jgi:predicted nucleic acid-binding protein
MNVYEFWVVATRALENNGLGMTVQQAKAKLEDLLLALVLLPDTPGIFPEWQRLVLETDCKGKPAHDARLVAAMNVHRVEEILTFNGSDFKRFRDITILDPMEIVK